MRRGNRQETDSDRLMDGLRYRQDPGAAWLVLLRGTRAVLLPADSSQERVDTVWASLQGSAPLEEVFDAVTGGLAGSLSRLPSFGLVSVDDQVNVLLRGPLELEIDGVPAGSGRNLRTWSEQVLPPSGRLILRAAAPQDEPNHPSVPLLQLREGMAAVREIEMDLNAVPGTASVPSGTAARPVPEPADIPPAPVQPPPAPAAPPAAAEPPAPVEPAAPAESPTPAESPVQADPPAEAGPALLPGTPATPAPADVEEGTEPAPGPDLSAAVPWLNLTPPPLSPDTAAAAGEPEAGGVPDSGEPTETLPPVDHDGHTVMGFRAQPGTALLGTPTPGPSVPAAQDSSAQDSSVQDRAGEADDDGETIRSAPAVPPAGTPSAGAASGPETGPTVLARTCPQGHINPPTSSACRFCGAELSGGPQPAARPSLGVMRLSTGAVYELDRNIVIGRQPSASRVAGAALPRMVQVPSDSGDISRSHAEVRLEGWHVMLRDLFSTNGTVLIREGSLPRRLAQGEAAILLDGDIAELGDGITLRFEGLA